MQEMDPRKIENRDNTLKAAIWEEKEPSHEQKLEILYPRALEIVRAYRTDVVPKVESLLKTFKSFDKFPQAEVEKLAYRFGDQTEMIENIARVLEMENGK